LEDGSDANAQRAAYADINEIFHRKIREAADSRLIADVLRLCNQIPQASAHNIIAFQIDDIRERHRFHHRIYDAILAREPREAEGLMRQHVVSVKTSMIRTASRRMHAAGAACQPPDAAGAAPAAKRRAAKAPPGTLE
jgi:GntR family transcriptional regulator of vanillate catabolism